MGEHRLGLALSGGGFRASLFHLGVLRRLAELGLLRQVTQMSTVSGGSIVAALYYLHFKKAFEREEGKLTNDDYVNVVKDVEVEFCKGVKKDIRNRLLACPMAHLREFTFGNGFGRRIARLYHSHFYRRVIADIFKTKPRELLKTYVKRGVPLHQLITRLPGQPVDEPLTNRSSGYPDRKTPETPLVDFNKDERYANIPSLVINATCLNTGGPFYFTLNEVGGPECGFIRTDEVFLVSQYKYLLENIGDAAIDPAKHERYLDGIFELALQYGDYMERTAPNLPTTAFRRERPGQPAADCFPRHTARHFSFYQAIRARFREGLDFTGDTWVPKEFEFDPGNPDLATLLEARHWEAVRHLYEANFGLLRRAKVAAWILLDHEGWKNTEFRGGLTRAQYQAELVLALEDIDAAFGDELLRDGNVPDGIAWFVVDLYYFRSAVVLNKKAFEALDRITLSETVAASANFPPMFTPFKINDLFESKHMEAVHLTDGGVHDNQGIEWLLDSGCTHIIASDASGLVSIQQSPSESRLPMMDRIIDLLMGGVRRVLLRSVRETLRFTDLLSHDEITHELRENLEARRSTRLKMATMFHMTSHPHDAVRQDEDGLSPVAPYLVAGLRTDLDAFNDLEIAALRHQGYLLADRYARRMLQQPEFAVLEDPPPAVSPSQPPPLDAQHIKVLKAGAHVRARYSVVHPWRSAVFAFFIAGIVSLFAAQFDDWSSWHSIERFAAYDLSKHLPRDRESFYGWLSDTPIWKAMGSARDRVIHFVAHTSIITVLFIGWAIYLIGRELFRASTSVRGHVQVQIEQWIRKDTIGAWKRVLKRPANLISLTAVFLACFTLHPKWLLAVVHLWAFPVAVFFFFVHTAFTWLWLYTGRIDPPVPEDS